MKTKSALYQFLLVVFLACTQACSQTTKKMEQEQFNYAVTFSAPEVYPAEVHYGYLTNDKKEMVAGVPKAGSVEGGWQYDGTKAGQGGNEIPTHLNVTYVSYVDKKFYQADVNLPKEKMLQLFRQGFEVKALKDTNGNRLWNKSTYNVLNIGAAPGGVVVVWLSGNHHRTEIGRYQAKEVFVDVNDFYDNPHARTQKGFFDELYKIMIPEETKAKIDKEGVPYGLWDKYREKYKYRFVLQSYHEEDYIKQVFRINYNGESEYLKAKEDVEKYKEDSVPYDVIFFFTKYNVELKFDDTELLNAFETLKKEYPNEPIDFVIKPDFMYKSYKAYVKCKDKTIELTKVTRR